MPHFVTSSGGPAKEGMRNLLGDLFGCDLAVPQAVIPPPLHIHRISANTPGVVDKCLGVGWEEETLLLLPHRSHRSTRISSPPPISTPPTHSPPTQAPKPPNQPTKQPTPTMSNPTTPAHPTKALAPPKDAANGLQPLFWAVAYVRNGTWAGQLYAGSI
ncbi:hypothetical protein PGT21_015732 [Puccinia graminis f. sp. tritici]|uniref:Uncharacterized protein n=1 Tax=Puccinia graminis f. sp. tritici TaxID=56615 RepID=A0A5B0RFT8_PUCGR|nr:hypothetical protein PGT21_015732 [Puccinia graminis f. sp. tritici]KAA1124706.1 hypothetical protein PGTUg99_031594 [Puccinia graminis f. sp. tritici]